MELVSYIKTNPISYLSVFGAFFLVTVISTFLWSFIILDIQAEYFGEMLGEQVMLKWLWFLASVSLLFLSVKIMVGGPIENYEERGVKIVGIYMGNAALAAAASYAGVLWGAVIPVVIFGQPLPHGLSVADLIYICLVCFILVMALYAFYLSLLANSTTAKFFASKFHNVTIRILVGLFGFFFFSGRALDVLRLFKPELF